MKKNNLPILIIGYMRFESILTILEECHRSGIWKVYLALDGAKSPEQFSYQEFWLSKMLDFIEAHKMSIKVRRRKSNAGLAVAVIEGISWFFEQEEFGVILEDDLKISPDFLAFVSAAQVKFESESKVALISGNNYELVREHGSVSASNYPLIWGWATWRPYWESFVTSIYNNFVPHFNHHYSLSVNGFWFSSALQSRYCFVDSWAMLFTEHFLKSDYLCIIPPCNLVSNLGVDAHAVHTNKMDQFVNFPVQTFENLSNWNLPSRDKIRAVNLNLERNVFRISTRNLLSPLKVLMRIIFNSKRHSLAKKLEKSSQASEFIVIERKP